MAWTYPIIETMTKPDENPFVSTWFTTTTCKIVSNRLLPPSPAAGGDIQSRDALTSLDFEARYVLGAVPDPPGAIYLLGHIQASPFGYYGCLLSDFSLNTATLRLAVNAAGSFAWLSDGAYVTVAPGYEIGLRKMGAVLTAYINDDWSAAGYQQGQDTQLTVPGRFGVNFAAATSVSASIYNLGGGPLPQPVAPGGSEADRGEFRGQLRGQLVGSP